MARSRAGVRLSFPPALMASGEPALTLSEGVAPLTVRCPAPLGWLQGDGSDTTRPVGRSPAKEAEMTRAPKISSAHAIALPRPAAPTELTEWVVAGAVVLLILAGLLL